DRHPIPLVATFGVTRHPPASTLFPYTTLFRSQRPRQRGGGRQGGGRERRPADRRRQRRSDRSVGDERGRGWHGGGRDGERGWLCRFGVRRGRDGVGRDLDGGGRGVQCAGRLQHGGGL